MSDLKRYIEKRKKRQKTFSKNYEEGYTEFKIGALLRDLREEAGITQEQLAALLHTQKSAISRIENQAEDIRLSTLFRIAEVLKKRVNINII
jgi:HTH-type transcriptional regulator / antitoxin HipB